MSSMEKDIVTVKIFPEPPSRIAVGTSSIIGTRKSQEDAIFADVQGERAIAVVCDGMGGLASGERASKAAAECFAEDWFGREGIADIPRFLADEAVKADERVFMQKNEQGDNLGAGTTIVAVIVQENELYWLSVGDSRIYIIRGSEILAVNREHNYKMELDRQMQQGKLTKEQYAAEEHRAEALISYLGMGNVSLMDVNWRPFLLNDGDIVLLSSDGLYKSLSEREILRIVQTCGQDMQAAAEALTAAALGNKQSGQDNTSVVALRYGVNDLEEDLKV